MIFDYDNFRDILRNEIKRRVEDNPLYSAHSFAKKIGLSQSYLSLILNDKRSLSDEAAQSVSNALLLSPLEKEYFLLLVKKEASQKEELIWLYQQKIAELKKNHDTEILDLEKFHLIADWHHSAILECFHLEKFEHTTKNFAAYLNLEEGEVELALKRLQNAGLVGTLESGHYYRIHTGFISTPHGIKSVGLRTFHKQILKKASLAIEEQSVEERNFSGITMALDPQKIPEAKIKIQNFMQELMKFLDEGNKTEIYQFSTQLFQLKNKSTTENLQ